MKIIIEIPNYEFDNDVKDKFQDYFKRVKADIADGTICGNYELETTDMFLASFKRLQILPDNTLQEVANEEWMNRIKQAKEEIDQAYEDFDGYDPYALCGYSSRVDEILDRLIEGEKE